MLANPAHRDSGRVAAAAIPQRAPGDSRPALLLAIIAGDLEQFPISSYAHFAARTTSEAIGLLDRCQPRVVVVDWDAPDFDGRALCEAARSRKGTAILITTASPDRAPSALKAGCHSVLLKPLTVSLTAARLGRLARAAGDLAASRIVATLGQCGTNQVWPEIACAQCGRGGAVFFEHSSHRRSWYACLQCDAVWRGRRRE